MTSGMISTGCGSTHDDLFLGDVARPDDPASLQEAQQQKIEWHLRHSGADRAARILDIGCGWGSMLRAAVRQRAAGAANVEQAVGLTLSNAQAELGRRLAADAQAPQIEIRIESWADHRPAKPYGALISVGAFEHFTKPDDDAATKIAIYRGFFERCHEMLETGAQMTLQTSPMAIPTTTRRPAL